MDFIPKTKNISINLNSDELSKLSALHEKGVRPKQVFLIGLAALHNKNIMEAIERS